jgi:hypothetical protein
LPAAGANDACAELDALKREAIQVSREVWRIRRSRDVSFYEDAELNGEKQKIIGAVIKHLLVGHEGRPCPAVAAQPRPSPMLNARYHALSPIEQLNEEVRPIM